MLKIQCCQQKRHIRFLPKWSLVSTVVCFSGNYIRKMSNSSLYVKAGYPRAVLGNGLGRVICQLQRVTIKFCKSHGSSRGVREFIENDLVNFAQSNPNVVVYVKPRRHRSPVFVAEYLNGERKWLSAHNFTRNEVGSWLNLFLTQSGHPEMRLIKTWSTLNPSIQGPWSPFLYRNPEFNISEFPQEKFSLPKNLPPSATEIVLDMYKKQISENQAGESSSPDVEFQGTDEIKIKV